ncbi:MAG: maleylpyruvate isomerase N-terminal domain-containing protein [Pseudonocardia sp.]
MRWNHPLADTFAEIADERRTVADMLSGLTREQQAARSQCDEWSVHDVAAHLVMPLEVGMPKFLLTMLACRGDFDRANVRLTRQQARRPFDEIVEVLRRRAESRFTPPGSGPEAPLDLLARSAALGVLTGDGLPSAACADATWVSGS